MATLFEMLQYFSNNGIPLAGGKVGWYQAGTNTLKTIWKDSNETQPHTNPVPLDQYGIPPGGAIFIRGSYKLKIMNSDQTITYLTIDNIDEFDQFDFTGLTASIADLNSTTTLAKIISSPLTYNVLLTDRGYTLMVNAVTGNATINLPSAAVVGNTFKIWIKKIDKSTNFVDIIPFGSQKIDGGTYKTLYDYNDFVEVRSDGSNWFLGGELRRGTISNIVSTPYNLVLEDSGLYFNCNAPGANITINLLSAATVGRGFTVGFKKIDASSHTINITASGAETIDGDSILFLTTQYDHATIKSDGINWYIVESSISEGVATTGDAKASIQTSIPGWVLMNDGSIGNVGSGATTRANVDTYALFSLIWNNVSNTYCHIETKTGAPTTRGASANDDWLALKRMPLPLQLGRAMISAGAASSVLWHLGQSGGSETHQLSIAELALHLHTELPLMSLREVLIGTTYSAYTNFNPILPYPTTDYAGSSAHFNLFQPSTAYNIFMKL